MKKSNDNLKKAKTSKKDEFYTQLSDIEKELSHYKEHFKDKIIFCNCDDPEESNFFFYFAQNFEFLGLKKLIATHYETEKPSYKLEITADLNNDKKINKLDTVKTPLKQNGDFRSHLLQSSRHCKPLVAGKSHRQSFPEDDLSLSV